MFKIILAVALTVGAFFLWQNWGASVSGLSAAEAEAVSVALVAENGGEKVELREPVLKTATGESWFVCGWVRMRGPNAVPGYQAFVGQLSKAGDFVVTSIASEQTEVNAVHSVCAYRGLVL